MNYKLNKTMTKGEIDAALVIDGLDKSMGGMSRAFKLLEEISVCRENVDLMASAKQELRLAFAQLKKIGQETEQRMGAMAAGEKSEEETDEAAEHGVCR